MLPGRAPRRLTLGRARPRHTAGLLAAAPARSYRGDVNTIHLSDAELKLTRHAMQAYLSTFGHDEADILAQVRSVLAKLDAAEHEGEQQVFVG